MMAMTQPASSDLITSGATRPERASGRHPAHALYEHAAGLLASAQSLEAAAQAPDAVPATAATLACVEASLDALASAIEQLRGHVLDRLSNSLLPGDDLRPPRTDVGLQLGRLCGVLEQGSRTCERARESMDPVSDELRAI
jgi:hypothetical protein